MSDLTSLQNDIKQYQEQVWFWMDYRLVSPRISYPFPFKSYNHALLFFADFR